MKNIMKIYNKEEIFQKIDKISIEKIEDQVITKYDNRVIKIANVSSRYEIFDIVKYLKNKIEIIENNFNITHYILSIKGGQQSLQLISDEVQIGGVNFRKSFYILNSTDKSRRLNFNSGLQSDKFYSIGKAVSMCKKHLKGVTQAAEDASVGLNGETFDEQIELIESLVGHRIKFSKIREVILGNGENTPDINHRRFDAFKNSVRYESLYKRIDLTESQRRILLTQSDRLNEIEDDFYLDAFLTFQIYMTIFNKQDSHIIKKETERIMGITQWAVRNSILESLGI
jgi:hypothetical protein